MIQNICNKDVIEIITTEKAFSYIKKKMLIFGTGRIWHRFSCHFDDGCIVGFLDNDISKQGSYYNGKLIYAPDNGIENIKFDIICIMSMHTQDILHQLVGLGINKDNIITYNQLLCDFEKKKSRWMFYDKVQKIPINDINILLNGKVAVFRGYDSVLGIFKYICREFVVIRDNDIPQDIDVIVYHGFSITPYQWEIYNQAIMRNVPVIFFEDGFIRSIFPGGFLGQSDLVIGRSIILDGRGLYINAHSESEMERILNSDFILTAEEEQRVEKLIDCIVSNKVSKYNHQPLAGYIPGRKGTKKILVVDQVPSDKSITYGLATDETFIQMLDSAIKENPNADILIKRHPATEMSHYIGTYGNNVYIMDEPINPITLLKQVDKVYVCSSQMGFEALMCGKEVHAFGMPFYAGWGATLDRQLCNRRKKKRRMEEIFYVAYVLLTRYISTKKGKVCEIEDAIEELLELRSEYFLKNGGITNE